MKLIVDSATDKVLGAAMVGPDAAEIMQVIAVSMLFLISSSYSVPLLLY